MSNNMAAFCPEAEAKFNKFGQLWAKSVVEKLDTDFSEEMELLSCAILEFWREFKLLDDTAPREAILNHYNGIAHQLTEWLSVSAADAAIKRRSHKAEA